MHTRCCYMLHTQQHALQQHDTEKRWWRWIIKTIFSSYKIRDRFDFLRSISSFSSSSVLFCALFLPVLATADLSFGSGLTFGSSAFNRGSVSDGTTTFVFLSCSSNWRASTEPSFCKSCVALSLLEYLSGSVKLAPARQSRTAHSAALRFITSSPLTQDRIDRRKGSPKEYAGLKTVIGYDDNSRTKGTIAEAAEAHIA